MEEKRIPKHIAIILDGNGRWARKRGMPRTYGHSKGSSNVEPVCRLAYEMGVKYLTLYAFSTENWKRPQKEVEELMRLLSKYMKTAMDLSRNNNMRVRVIGDKRGLSPTLVKQIEELEDFSKGFDGLNLQIAINYGGRDEIKRAFLRMVKDAEEKGLSLDEFEEEVTEENIIRHLDTSLIPDPDLMIRTSGEQRLSNYLIWQLAYAEFFFTDTLWPDFSKKDMEEAFAFYEKRDRRFGGI